MKEFIEKLFGRLEEKVAEYDTRIQRRNGNCYYDETQNQKKLDERARGVEQSIEIVNQLAEEYKDKHNDHDLMIVESLPSLYPLQDFEEKAIHSVVASAKNTDWIPCSRELPPQPKDNPLFENKPLELYLVSVNSTDYPFRAFWNGKFWTDGFSNVEVIAWQPLPEPYQPEGE